MNDRVRLISRSASRSDWQGTQPQRAPPLLTQACPQLHLSICSDPSSHPATSPSTRSTRPVKPSIQAAIVQSTDLRCPLSAPPSNDPNRPIHKNKTKPQNTSSHRADRKHQDSFPIFKYHRAASAAYFHSLDKVPGSKRLAKDSLGADSSPSTPFDTYIQPHPPHPPG